MSAKDTVGDMSRSTWDVFLPIRRWNEHPQVRMAFSKTVHKCLGRTELILWQAWQM